MDFGPAACLVHCPRCAQSRIVRGLVAALVQDAAGQGVLLRCILTAACDGTASAVASPAPILDRPAAARAGQHVAPCPGCQAPLQHSYLYGYTASSAVVPCPHCRTDLLAHALRDWPRGEDHSVPIDLEVRPVMRAPPHRAAANAPPVEVHLMGEAVRQPSDPAPRGDILLFAGLGS